MNRADHPADGGADNSSPPDPKKDARVSARLAELLKEFPPGRTCPKCGGSMAHYRLYGYRCLRRCG